MDKLEANLADLKSHGRRERSRGREAAVSQACELQNNGGHDCSLHSEATCWSLRLQRFGSEGGWSHSHAMSRGPWTRSYATCTAPGAAALVLVPFDGVAKAVDRSETVFCRRPTIRTHPQVFKWTFTAKITAHLYSEVSLTVKKMFPKWKNGSHKIRG
uniref:Expressed protein n=1 Tax=Oryza sativa subsp. japonica TaxID=39947 RepID=Q10NU2_ORYSJ|nr:expressed protein [Oryza sativa Japonica Group]